MNCNTEDIQRIAEAVAKLVQGGMRQKQSEIACQRLAHKHDEAGRPAQALR